MKWLSFLAIIPVAAAFNVPIIHHHHQKSRTSLNFFPDKFSRAEECATDSNSCTLEELDELKNELDRFQSSDAGKLQDRDDYKDTQRVSQMLHEASQLKHHQEDYLLEHHHSYMENVLNEEHSGIGLGLW